MRGGGGRAGRWWIALGALVLACGGEDAGSDGPFALDTAEADRLAALGYAQWHEGADRSQSGVSVAGPGTSDGAVYLYGSRPGHAAWLVDRRGVRLHGWSGAEDERDWQHTEIGPDGDLYVIDKRGWLSRRGWSSEVRWRQSVGAHHDLDLAADGTLFALARRFREVPFGDGTVEIVDDRVLEVSPQGHVRRAISLFDLLGDRIPEPRLRRIARRAARAERDPGSRGPGSAADVFHANSIQLVAWDDVPEGGAILLSVRELRLLVVVRLDTPEVLWSWGKGVLDAAHHATLQPDGRILLFDNGFRRGWSRILSVDPRTGAFETRYAAPDFFSARRGGVEATPGGGLLVTESDEGRVFELDAGGRIVWEFWNPELSDSKDGTARRGALYRMSRVDPARLPPELLARADGAGESPRSH